MGHDKKTTEKLEQDLSAILNNDENGWVVCDCLFIEYIDWMLCLKHFIVINDALIPRLCEL